MQSVSVIGLGYMGLPMAAILACAGHDVTGVDICPAVVDCVNRGECPFTEPGMPELVNEAHASGRLRAVAAPVAADIFLLSLPTPVDHATHAADMSYVEAGARSIAPVLKAGDLVILESTSPIGATRRHVKAVIEAMRPELADAIDYVFCPERAIPGSTLREMTGNDRLIGGLTPEATRRAAALYRTFCTGKLLECSTEEAEMVKLVENASRDVQIAFANELSLVCNHLGLDVWNIIGLANHHPRVNILTPSSGVGGHCIAVDPWFIINEAPDLTPLMRAARQVNDGKPHWVEAGVRGAAAEISRHRQGPVRVACLGLSYKPDVDDTRESPSLTVIEELAKDPNLELMVVEPHLDSWDKPLSALEEAMAKADIVVSLTAHSQFKQLPEGALQDKWVVDACGIFRNRPDVTRTVL